MIWVISQLTSFLSQHAGPISLIRAVHNRNLGLHNPQSLGRFGGNFRAPGVFPFVPRWFIHFQVSLGPICNQKMLKSAPELLKNGPETNTGSVPLVSQSAVCAIFSLPSTSSSIGAISSPGFWMSRLLWVQRAAANHPCGEEEENIRSKSSVIAQSLVSWQSTSLVVLRLRDKNVFKSSRSICIYGRAWEWTLTSLTSRLLTTKHCLQYQGESEGGRNCF